jgi:NADH-ubiquinone oxidoreductase chain 5
MSLPLIILAFFSIFFGYITKDIFIGLGSAFFADNSLFIHPIHEKMLDTEFAVSTFFKTLPLLFTISIIIIAIAILEFFPIILIFFKLSRFGYNIFGFFNQRFFIELLYNTYISGQIYFKFAGHTSMIIDKGSVELLGPYGSEKGLISLSRKISNLNTGVITDYALYISMGLVLYTSLYNLTSYDNSLFVLLLLGLLTLTRLNIISKI